MAYYWKIVRENSQIIAFMRYVSRRLSQNMNNN